MLLPRRKLKSSDQLNKGMIEIFVRVCISFFLQTHNNGKISSGLELKSAVYARRKMFAEWISQIILDNHPKQFV